MDAILFEDMIWSPIGEVLDNACTIDNISDYQASTSSPGSTSLESVSPLDVDGQDGVLDTEISGNQPQNSQVLHHPSRLLTNSQPIRVSSRTRPLPPHEWERHRPRITQLYSIENRTLSEVACTMNREYGFKASKKMYKTRLRKWEIYKYLKRREILAIWAWKLRRDAEGKQSIFTLRNQEVDMADVNRSIRKRGLTKYDVLSYQSSNIVEQTPGVRCLTPPNPNSSLRTPDQLDRVETLFHSTTQFVRRSIETGLCWPISVSAFRYIAQTSGFRTTNEMVQLVTRNFQRISAGLTKCRMGASGESFSLWSLSFQEIDDVPFLPDILTWAWLFAEFSDFMKYVPAEFGGLAAMLFQQIKNMTREKIRVEDPHYLVIQDICRLEFHDLSDIAVRYIECIADELAFEVPNKGQAQMMYYHEAAGLLRLIKNFHLTGQRNLDLLSTTSDQSDRETSPLLFYLEQEYGQVGHEGCENMEYLAWSLPTQSQSISSSYGHAATRSCTPQHILTELRLCNPIIQTPTIDEAAIWDTMLSESITSTLSQSALEKLLEMADYVLDLRLLVYMW